MFLIHFQQLLLQACAVAAAEVLGYCWVAAVVLQLWLALQPWLAWRVDVGVASPWLASLLQLLTVCSMLLCLLSVTGCPLLAQAIGDKSIASYSSSACSRSCSFWVHHHTFTSPHYRLRIRCSTRLSCFATAVSRQWSWFIGYKKCRLLAQAFMEVKK
jgi:hypothetical protein